jgi:UDP-N-acetylmuramoyl-L-alanyl-D-glutamate--2,6-diaminopimelate ligase
MNKDKIEQLLKDIIVKKNFNNNVEIKNLTSNIQGTSKGSAVFYKVQESKKAEDIFIDRLSNSNPELIITNKYVDNLDKYNYIIVDIENYLVSQKILADEIYKFDETRIKLVGITGTNGKTTVANLSVQIARQYSKKAFSIGTIGIFDHEKEIYPTPHATTPSYIELRKILSKFQNDYDVLFFEVSSHALEQDRLFDIRLDIAAWTSFSQDHLDYHNSIEEYFNAKLKISNIAKELYIPDKENELEKMLKERAVKYIKASTLLSRRIEKLSPAFQADYNKSNLELSLMLNEVLWGENKIDVSNLNPPRGRFSTIPFKKGFIIVDYAHTPDALENVCQAIKDGFSDYTLSVIFGCGGDRDRAKRPLMGRAVKKFADNIVVTSDNPRSENPDQIIDDIIPGLKDTNFHRIVDRKEAIQKAIVVAKENTVILIAGKGHEEYQEINGEKQVFSDFNVAEELINEMGLNV